MPTTVDLRLPRLPACHTCYTKKVKCDNNRPKCAPCVRSGSECITLGLDNHQSVSRGYISELEQKVRTLQAELQNAIDQPHEAVEDISQSRKRRRRSSMLSTYSSPSFTEGAGLSFMRPLFTDPGWRAHNPTILQNLSNSARLVEASITRNPLPAADEARTLFDKYLNGSQKLKPFLLRREVEDIYQRVFLSNREEDRSEHDLFRAFMILALGSIYPFRHGFHNCHPYGYFLSAMQQFKTQVLCRGLRSIQDLLLIGRFAIYHHIGTSIWDINQLCIRLCIEQGLHRPPTSHRTLLLEQLERRVFWECYVIDRYSSTTLDRPLAIPDRDVQVLLPVDANDEELEAAEGSFSDLDVFQITSPLRSGHSEITIFLTSIRHRQITSKIHSLFQVQSSLSTPTVTAAGRIYADLYRLLQELDDWRQSVPVFDKPKCLYETQDWTDLRWMRERLMLVRKAMDLVPKRGSTPPRDLLSLCLEIAIKVITIFGRLYGKQKMTYTRSYFQTFFTAGLSVLFYLSVVTDPDAVAVDQALDALFQCEQTLKELGRELPDAAQYVAVYEALYRHISQKLRQSGRLDRHPTDTQLEFRQPFLVHAIDHGLSDQQLLTANGIMGEWPLLTPHSLPTETGTEQPLPQDLMSLSALFWDDTLWSMEAGLGEYAYGNPHGSFDWDDGAFPL